MNSKVLIKNIKSDKTLPSYIKADLISIVKSYLYEDTYTIIKSLDSSPRSRLCVHRFSQLNPAGVRTKQQVIDFKKELTSIKNEALKCTINPYFYRPTGLNSDVRTLGDIIVPNSKVPLSINSLVLAPQYNHLNKPKMIKDFLMTWNNDAKKYLEDKVKENHEYLAKSHYNKFTSPLLKVGTLLGFIACILSIIQLLCVRVSEQSALYSLIVFVGFAVLSITNAVVNSFHSRKLRKYDQQMRRLDYFFDRYADYTFDIEDYAMRKIQSKKICDLPLSNITIMNRSMDKFDIDRYVFSEKYIANRRYWLLKALAFLGFVACIVCTILLFTLKGY